MTTFAPGYPLPRSSDEFERLCLKLLRRHWQLPQLERFRDPERATKGINLIEISGRPRLAAVKCELRDSRSELTVAEIKNAVDRAASAKLPIGRFVIATTAAKPEGLQRSIFDLNRANKSGGISAIEVLTWNDIEDLLDEYPQILTDFGTSAQRQVLTRADAVVHLEAKCEPAAAGPSDTLGEEVTAAAALLQSRQFQLARLGLLRIREQKWTQLSNLDKFRVLSYLGVAWLKEGEPRKAAMLFIAAKSLQPDEENACTNEALAHELLGERDRAFALVEKLRIQFPGSGRAVALWLNNAPKSFDAKFLEENVAPELTTDPEVAIVMARRALIDGHFERAEHFARVASNALPNSSIPWLVLGQAILIGELEAGATSAQAQNDQSRVRESENCFTQALTFAQSETAVSSEVQALIGRAQARIALRDADGAGKDIEQARGLEREDANGLCEYGIVLRARGSLNESVEILRRAAAVGGRDDADYHLAVTLRERDEPGDLQEAVDLLIRAISQPDSIPEGDFPFAVACAVEALASLERYHEADALLGSIGEGYLPALTMLTLRANLRLSQGKFDQASRFADQALSVLEPDTGADIRRKLAALLHDLGRYRDALALWQILAPSGSTGTDTRRLLDCASRLGREDIVSDIARKLHPEQAAEPEDSAKRLDKLERIDPEAALAAIEEVLRAHPKDHPDDRMLKLRRSIIAARLGKVDLVVTDPNAMPSPREIPPALGRAAVRFMRDSGRANEALAYAYDLLRRQPASVDSHRAYLAALGPAGPMPHVPDFETAGPGAALLFVEDNSGTERWIVLEEVSDPDEARDEYGPQHAMTRALKGKKVGEKFQLPEGRFSRKSATVKQMMSKYARRYIDCLGNFQARFPGAAEVDMSPVNSKSIPWNEMSGSFEPMFDAADGNGSGNREDVLKHAESIYASKPVPIHAVAERINLNDLQTVFIMAQSPDAPIKCCTGAPEELEAALGAFERANAIVLDLTAIATLCMLGRLSWLPTWPRQFVISQSTLAELRRLAFDDALLRLPPGFSASLGIAGDGKRADLQLKGLADALQSVCRVRDGAVLASIGHDRRERLIAFFGRHGAESIAIASMPGHVLWTDDMILADLARTEFGVRRVWTEAAMQARAQAGNLDPAELATASTKLAGWGYAFTTPSIETLMRAGSVAVWNPDQFPLKQGLDQFAADSMNLSDAMRLGSEMIVKIYSDAHLRGQRRIVTSRLLDRIATRPGGREAVEMLPRSLPIRFGLNLIHARELSDVVRGWTAQGGAKQPGA